MSIDFQTPCFVRDQAELLPTLAGQSLGFYPIVPFSAGKGKRLEAGRVWGNLSL
jgi:hypothetical protein